MGIVILMALAFGIFSVLRAASGFVRTCSNTSTSATSVSVQPAPSAEPDWSAYETPTWSAYETPTFIRRGISHPVLSKKKQKRVRKTQSANANLIEAVLSCFEERSLAIANMHNLEVKDDLKVELRASRSNET